MPAPTQMTAISGGHPYSPRPHQKDQITEALNFLLDAGHDRVQCVMACGTGKTLVAERIAEGVTADIDEPLILALYPNLGLLDQNVRNWQLDSEWPRTLAGGKPFHAIAFCSDTKVGQDDDECTTERTDLSVESTTDPDALAAWIQSHPGPKVVFGTYQSSPAIARMHKAHRGLFRWDAAVCDEAHRTAGPDAGIFATVLSDKHIPVAKRVFLTATPRIHSGKGITKSDGAGQVISMDDEMLYGPRCTPLTAHRAIADGLLHPFDIAVICISDADLLAATQAMGYANVDDTGLTVKELAVAIACIRAGRDHHASRQLVFHSRIADSDRFAKKLSEIAGHIPPALRLPGAITGRHIQGGTPAADRKLYLEQLNAVSADQTYVVSNVRCLTEGIDVPNLDAVVFAAPRSSRIDIIQAIGRASRKGTGANVRTSPSLIIVPVYVGEDENIETAIESGAFDAMYSVICAAADVDEVIVERFAAGRRRVPSPPVGRKAESTGTAVLPVQIIGVDGRAIDTDEDGPAVTGFQEPHGPLISIQLPGQIDAAIDIAPRAPVDPRIQRLTAKRLAETLSVRIARAVIDAWEIAAADLTQWVQDAGRMPTRDTGDQLEKSLSHWVDSQRRNQAKLSPTRRSELEAIAGWRWSSHTPWAKRASDLVAFVARTGRQPVRTPTDQAENSLAQWATSQKSHRLKLSSEQQQTLELTAGWLWTAVQPWEGRAADLDSFVSRGGGFPSRRSGDPAEKSLAQWVTGQRMKRAEMPIDRQVALEAIPGWRWQGGRPS